MLLVVVACSPLAKDSGMMSGTRKLHGLVDS